MQGDTKIHGNQVMAAKHLIGCYGLESYGLTNLEQTCWNYKATMHYEETINDSLIGLLWARRPIGVDKGMKPPKLCMKPVLEFLMQDRNFETLSAMEATRRN